MSPRHILTAEDVRAKAERIYSHFSANSVQTRIGTDGPHYFYHYGITEGGRVEIMGPETVDEAEKFAADLDEGEVFDIDTYVLAKATQQIKAEMLKRGKSHDLVLQKVSHIRRT